MHVFNQLLPAIAGAAGGAANGGGVRGAITGGILGGIGSRIPQGDPGMQFPGPIGGGSPGLGGGGLLHDLILQIIQSRMGGPQRPPFAGGPSNLPPYVMS